MESISLNVIDQAHATRKLLFNGFVVLGVLDYGQALLKSADVGRIVREGVMSEPVAGEPLDVRKTMQKISMRVILRAVFGLNEGPRYQQLERLLANNEWLERLQTMLKPLTRKKLAVWADTKINAGAKWKDEIQGALAAAKVAVLLVSPNFLGSDFIADHELPPLLNAAEKEGLVILWVYLSSCLYEETEIVDYEAAHNISKPLDSLTPAEQNSVLTDVCRQIKAAANPQ